jgi:hypothetical protein
MTDMSGFAGAAETNDIVRQMVEGAPPQAPAAPAAPAQSQQWPAGPVVWPTGPASTQIPDPSIPPPAGMPTAPVAPLIQPPAPPAAPPVAPDPYVAPTAPAPPAGPALVTLPDGSTIDVDTLRQIASVGGERLQQLATLDHAFRARPDVQRAVEDAVNRGGLFPSPTPPAPQAAPAPGFPVVPGYPPAPPAAFAPPAAPALPAPGAPTGYPLAPPRTPALPAGVDLEDPTVQWVAQQRAEMQAQIDQQRVVLAQNQQQQLASGVARARHDVAQKYPNLSFDDWARAETYASQMGFAVGRFNTGGDYYEAARFALETAVETMPDPSIRARLSSRPMNDAQIQHRQQQLAAVAGTGAAAPRQDAPQVMAMSPDQRIQGMARELEAYAQGQQA